MFNLNIIDIIYLMTYQSCIFQKPFHQRLKQQHGCHSWFFHWRVPYSKNEIIKNWIFWIFTFYLNFSKDLLNIINVKIHTIAA